MIGTGSRTMKASFQFMRNMNRPMPTMVRTETTASITVHATKSQMRSVSLVTRVTSEPVGFLEKKLRLSLCRCS